MFTDFFEKLKREEELDKAKNEIHRLEMLLGAKESTIANLEERNKYLYESLAGIKQAVESTPSDCKPDGYCYACKFSKRYVVPTQRGGYSYIYLCDKAGACKNFTPQEVGQ